MILEQFNNLEQFNDTERVIIRHIQDHTDELDKMTIRSLAAQTFTSTTTVNRFCNHICNGGFKEFKTQLLKTMIRKISIRMFLFRIRIPLIKSAQI